MTDFDDDIVIYVTVTNAQGPVGPAGPPGAPGSGSPDTAAQVLAKILTVDGSGSGLDADLLDGLDAAAYLDTPSQLLDKLLTVDGVGSGLDADLLDGLDSSSYLNASNPPDTGAQILSKLLPVDGAGSGLDADLLDGLDSSAFLKQASIVSLTPTTGTIVIDMATADGNYLTQTLTGDPSYSLSNRIAGRTTTARILADVATRTFTFPAGWAFVGTKPTTIVANKVGILTVTCFDTTEAGVLAAYSVQA